jgi:hypothetical protein
MTVPELIAHVARLVPEGAPFRTRGSASAHVAAPDGPHLVTISARIDAKGRRREHLLVDGVRVERPVLLRLTCAESQCPQSTAVRQQWAAFHGRRQGAPEAAEPPAPPRPRSLIEEVPVVVARHRCIARPARFECFTPCPHHAHPPMRITKTGYDLFEGEQYLGGGVVEDRGVRRPRLPDLRAAEAFVLARYLEALALLMPRPE